jgi:hypothetical protein
MSRLSGFHANGVNFFDTARPDVNELVGEIPVTGTLHLAILQQPYLDLITNGDKTIESRFNTKRAAPFGKVAVGDLVLMKEPGLPITFYFFVASVACIDLEVEPIQEVRQQYGPMICPQNEDEFWRARESSRYCTLIGVGEKGPLADLAVTKKDQRGWVTFLRSDPIGPLTLFE